MVRAARTTLEFRVCIVDLAHLLVDPEDELPGPDDAREAACVAPRSGRGYQVAVLDMGDVLRSHRVLRSGDAVAARQFRPEAARALLHQRQVAHSLTEACRRSVRSDG